MTTPTITAEAYAQAIELIDRASSALDLPVRHTSPEQEAENHRLARCPTCGQDSNSGSTITVACNDGWHAEQREGIIEEGGCGIVEDY